METPVQELHFQGECPDCGGRRVELPRSLAPLGDDFDWRVRDYDGFRVFLLEELAARFPERSRWTPADVEVTLIEALSAVLDQLSDMMDRVASEATLETARRPESVRRLLQMIGFDAVDTAFDAPDPGPPTDPPDPDAERLRREQALELYWLRHPEVMEAARRAGPRLIRRQRRMVTTEDYANRLEDHPLVHRAHAWTDWSGSWTTVHVAVVAWDEHRLDDAPEYPAELQLAIEEFHDEHRLPRPEWDGNPSLRQVLRLYLDAYRMAGQEVLLEDATPVGIILGLSVIVDERYFRSEVRRAVEQALGRGPGGFFAPGRLRFGEDLHASDLFEALMDVEGVVDVTLDRFKRVGAAHPDRAAEGRITLRGLEVAVCDNDPARPERGYFRLNLCGGRRG
ncbi:MAG TPA: hypothetical protein VN493_18715 [Thermoanaerobaculia bacterium]|nr:hypothetical protein [Thermoanaerobaculia bacterium]